MGCGASQQSSILPQQTQYVTYQCYGTDYTNYKAIHQQYHHRPGQEPQQQQHHNAQQWNQHNQQMPYNEQAMWSNYERQHLQLQAKAKQKEIERERKLKDQLRQQLEMRRQEHEAHVEITLRIRKEETSIQTELNELSEQIKNEDDQQARELLKQKEQVVREEEETRRRELEDAEMQAAEKKQRLDAIKKQMSGLIVIHKFKKNMKKHVDESLNDESSSSDLSDMSEDEEDWKTEEEEEIFEHWDELLDEEEEDLDFGEEEEDATEYNKWVIKASKEKDKKDETLEVKMNFKPEGEEEEKETEDTKIEHKVSEEQVSVEQEENIQPAKSETDETDGQWKSLEVSLRPKDQRAEEVGGLKVIVLDTLPQQDRVSFIEPRPNIPSGTKFVDKSFPKNVALGRHAADFEWKRPSEVYPDAKICLFHEGASIDDVKQGSFGDCYFIATIAALATHPEVMKQILPNDAYDPELGIFHCRFWRFGHWHDIYVDDFLPCQKTWDELSGARSGTNKGEMWISLLEKAWAKFNISYEAMESGQPTYAYQSLTGGTPELLFYGHDFYKGKFTSESVYSRVSNAVKSGSLVIGSAGSSGEISSADYKKAEDSGLVMNHAYTITAAALVKKTGGNSESLVRLRNPWAHKEWTGPYSDSSDKWKLVPAEAKKAMLDSKDNGEFWMPWKDFYKYFSSVNICHYSPDFDSDGIADGLVNVSCIYGQWKGKLTGGWASVECNPTFEFATMQSDKIVVELINETKSRSDKATGSISIHLVEMSNPPRDVDNSSRSFITTISLTRPFEVKANTKYHIRPLRYELGEEGKFLMRIFSKEPLKVVPIKIA